MLSCNCPSTSTSTSCAAAPSQQAVTHQAHSDSLVVCEGLRIGNAPRGISRARKSERGAHDLHHREADGVLSDALNLLVGHAFLSEHLLGSSPHATQRLEIIDVVVASEGVGGGRGMEADLEGVGGPAVVDRLLFFFSRTAPRRPWTRWSSRTREGAS